MMSQATPPGRFQGAIRDRHLRRATMAARELGTVSSPEASVGATGSTTSPSACTRSAMRGQLGSSTTTRSPSLCLAGVYLARRR
jgi:hypothetical protein